uniref:CBS domain-containing protein n=1 Tax=Setaria italica TaxID=4555 RepID=K3YWD4_SETIT
MACINTLQSCSIARGAKINTGTRRSAAKRSPTFQCRASTFVDASVRLELDENPEAIISGEWPENSFLLSYDDLRAYLESQEAVQEGDQPQTKIEEVMTSPAITLASDKTVMDAAVLMLKKKIHRVPIVNQDEQVIGIITRADVLRELEGLLKI